MAHQIDAVQSEAIKKIVVVQNQIGQPVEMLEILSLLRARVRRRVDLAVGREVIEKAVPLLPERTVKINHRRARTLYQDGIGSEAARQFDILRGCGVHAWTLASTACGVEGYATCG